MKPFKFLSIMLVLVTFFALAGPSNARQNPPVQILVVDDFSGQMNTFYAALQENPELFDTFVATTGTIYGYIFKDGQDVDEVLSTEIQSLITDSFKGQMGDFVDEIIDGAVSGTQNCVISPEGQNYYNTGGANYYNTGGAGGDSSTPHGQRVLSELDGLNQTYGGGHNISIVDVPAPGYTTTVITRSIVDAILNAPDANFVINMSFAVVPCAKFADFVTYDAVMRLLAEQSGDLAQDVAALDKMRQVVEWLVGASRAAVDFQNLNPGDPLFALFSGNFCDPEYNADSAYYLELQDGEACGDINSRVEGGAVIPVGSAGNDGVPFPYYPAAWETVVSVSASEEEQDFYATPPLASYSNWGEVMMPGDWTAPWGNLQQGTSFAAPRLSYIMALYLEDQGSDVCKTSYGPALAYPLTQTENNLSLRDAVQAKCPVMEKILP
jgi:hypothetical protein